VYGVIIQIMAMHEIKHILRAMSIHIINPQANKERAVYVGEELESLIDTLGAEVVARVIQKLENPDNATYIGKGKLREVAGLVKEKDVDVVILSTAAKSRQVYALKRELQRANPKIEVWDRVDLILQIFDKHAATVESKLQIDLARMRYMGPRIYGMGFVMSQQGGGIGTKGVGETNTELMKRHWRTAMKKVVDELRKINVNREIQLERRKRTGIQTVSIVGYTNAGKSSLFNLLTGKSTLVENELFATLDSTVGKLYLQKLQKEILITDTIGFIRNLPPKLIDAFKSTLMESMHADILLHVIDVSDTEVDTKIHVVNNILKDLGRNIDNDIYVFNKIDAINLGVEELKTKYADYSPLVISVRNNIGLEAVKTIIAEKLSTIANK
jgi:GTP-binding protein HflX